MSDDDERERYVMMIMNDNVLKDWSVRVRDDQKEKMEWNLKRWKKWKQVSFSVTFKFWFWSS